MGVAGNTPHFQVIFFIKIEIQFRVKDEVLTSGSKGK